MRSVLLLQREELNMLNLTAHVWGHDAPKEKPHGAQYTEGPANNSTAILPPADGTTKQFKTLAARFALAGHVLVESNPAHGPVSYYATRWGMAKMLPDLDAAEAFLIQIGGAA